MNNTPVRVNLQQITPAIIDVLFQMVAQDAEAAEETGRILRDAEARVSSHQRRIALLEAARKQLAEAALLGQGDD